MSSLLLGSITTTNPISTATALLTWKVNRSGPWGLLLLTRMLRGKPIVVLFRETSSEGRGCERMIHDNLGRLLRLSLEKLGRIFSLCGKEMLLMMMLLLLLLMVIAKQVLLFLSCRNGIGG